MRICKKHVYCALFLRFFAAVRREDEELEQVDKLLSLAKPVTSSVHGNLADPQVVTSQEVSNAIPSFVLAAFSLEHTASLQEKSKYHAHLEVVRSWMVESTIAFLPLFSQCPSMSLMRHASKNAPVRTPFSWC